jgi:threonine synthase
MSAPATGCVTDLVCLLCGRHVPDGNVQTCPVCGAEGILDVRYDYDRVAKTLTRESLSSRSVNHWRYGELLPISPLAAKPPLAVGWTPVYEVPRLAKEVGAGRLFIKDEGRNPTASFKDRASSVAVMHARRRGMPPPLSRDFLLPSASGASYFYRSGPRSRKSLSSSSSAQQW